MKKLILIGAAAMAAFSMASCTKESSSSMENPGVLSASEITVVNAVKSTKGYVAGSAFVDSPYDKMHVSGKDDADIKDDADTVGTKTKRTMMLSAYYEPQTGEACNYFVAETFSKGDKDAYWHHDPKIYWPIGAKSVDFLALSTTKPFTGTAIEWDEDNAANQVVLNVSEDYKQDDILYSSLKGRTTDGGSSVALTFQHAQAWIEFQLKVPEVKDADVKESDPTTAKKTDIITINSITLENIYTRGELTIKGGATASSSWDFQRETAKDCEMDDTYEVCGEPLTETVQYMDMLIPAQAQTKFLIKYTLAGQDTELEYEYTLNSAKWLAGQRYIYAITFTPYEITVTPQVTAFEDADMTSDDFPSEIE